MRVLRVLAVVLTLAGCAAPQSSSTFSSRSPEEAARSFVAVVDRVEPVAEAMCRARRPRANCDLQIVIFREFSLPPNAFQTLDRSGRPLIGFTLSLIATARNDDELAFVLSHEAAHHILGHVARSIESARQGAALAKAIATGQGANPREIREAEAYGAALLARSYAKEFELEADALGTEIALRAGFDPVRGAAFFDQLPDPGDKFLGSHPPNAQRQALVRATAARLQ